MMALGAQPGTPAGPRTGHNSICSEPALGSVPCSTAAPSSRTICCTASERAPVPHTAEAVAGAVAGRGRAEQGASQDGWAAHSTFRFWVEQPKAPLHLPPQKRVKKRYEDGLVFKSRFDVLLQVRVRVMLLISIS